MAKVTAFLRPLRHVKWGIQRARRGYSERDVWNLDHYLATVIAGGCRALAADTHGYPNSGPDDPFTFEDWQKELRHAADLFQEIADDDYGLLAAWDVNGDREPKREQYDAIYAREAAVNKEAMEWLTRRFGHLWD